MRSFQFWILLLCSSFVTFLYIKQIFLSRDLNQQQRVLVDSQQVVTEGATYESAWKQLAMQIFQASRQDPALADVLKRENVDVHPAANTNSGSPTNPATPPKAPAAPPHPGTP
jgi:hypothetical protein